MTTFSLRKDLVFDWDGAAFRIAGLQPTGDLLLERASDLQLQIHSRKDILDAYATCAISVPTLGEQSGRNPPFILQTALLPAPVPVVYPIQSH
jgi:hypothetical protein